MTQKMKSNTSKLNRVLTSSSVLAVATVGSATFLGLAPGMGLIPSIFALSLGALGIGTTIFSSRKVADTVPGSKVTPVTASIEIYSDLKDKVEELHSLAQFYERTNSPLFPALNGLLANVQELFSRMTDKSDEQSARIAAVRYTDTLTKLNTALGLEYYLDIEAHPELWSHPDERMAAVETALNATSEQILRNIRQLNSSKDLIYQLSMDRLMETQHDEQNSQDMGIS